MLNKHFTIMQILTGVYNFFRPRIAGMVVAILFLAIVLISIGFTNWNVVDQDPQDPMDSNIQGIGMLILLTLLYRLKYFLLYYWLNFMGAPTWQKEMVLNDTIILLSCTFSYCILNRSVWFYDPKKWYQDAYVCGAYAERCQHQSGGILKL